MGHFAIRILGAFGLLLIASGAAVAQAVTDVTLAPKQSGGVYPLALNAENRNCNQLLDFRFTSQASWIKLPADPVARQIPQGASRAIQASIDLRGAAPGERQGIVEVECENCGFFIFKSCKVDKQQLRFIVNVLPLAAAGPGGPAAAPPPQGGGGPANPGGGGAPPPVVPKVKSDDGFKPPPGRQPPAVDPEGPNVPDQIKKKWRRACKAGAEANDKLTKCEEELKKLSEAADAAAKAMADANAAYEKLARETLKEAEAVDALHRIYEDALLRAQSAFVQYAAAGLALKATPEKDWITYPTIDGPAVLSPELQAFQKAKAEFEEAAEALKSAQEAHLKAALLLKAKLSKLEAAEDAVRAAEKRAREATAAVRAKEEECERLRQEAARAAKEKQDAEDEAGEHCGVPW